MCHTDPFSPKDIIPARMAEVKHSMQEKVSPSEEQ